ncbi:cupin-like domain-containing protein [Pseudomonas fluorescens]|uniref:Cupin-like domain-containing protein n=1 Tax=Pseudomonas fluorescens TaxID=294 RepID=A0A7M2JEF3_PSEFL|nr:cupin-like domain-containing protein [Pseudomonas fluorescens]QOU08087.1 cupin-like domain-containing protein [Pseudomonas fluorescens]
MPNKNITLLDEIDAGDVMLFQKNYLANENPVILKGMGKDWPAIKRWSADFFRNTYGHIKVPVCYYKTKPQEPYKNQVKIDLQEYIRVAENYIFFDNNTELPYLGGWIFHKELPELLDDIDMTLPCFPDNWLYKLPPSISIPPTNLLIGYQHVSSPLHTDSFFVNSVLTMIVGEKKARIVSPSHTFAVSNGQDLFNPDIANKVIEQGAEIFEGTISAGDAFYIPPGWWHNVINCGFTIAVQNLHVDTYRFPLFEQQIRGLILPTLSKIDDLGRDAREELFKAKKTLPPPLSHQIGDFVEHEKNYIMFLKKSVKKSEDYLNSYYPQNPSS